MRKVLRIENPAGSLNVSVCPLTDALTSTVPEQLDGIPLNPPYEHAAITNDFPDVGIVAGSVTAIWEPGLKSPFPMMLVGDRVTDRTLVVVPAGAEGPPAAVGTSTCTFKWSKNPDVG